MSLHQTVRRPGFLCLAGASSAVCLAACALAAEPAPSKAISVQLLVKLVSPSDDAADVAASATRLAGVPVRHVSTVSPAWHALSLRCASASDCEAAAERLRQARDRYEAVEIDGRRRPQ